MNTTDELLLEAIKCFDKEDRTRNPDVDFGQYVGSELSSIPDGFTKDNAKLEIQHILMTAKYPHQPQTSNYGVSCGNAPQNWGMM